MKLFIQWLGPLLLENGLVLKSCTDHQLRSMLLLELVTHSWMWLIGWINFNPPALQGIMGTGCLRCYSLLYLTWEIINARAIYQQVFFGRELAFTSSKQELCEQLILPHASIKENRKVTPEIRYQRPNTDDVAGSVDHVVIWWILFHIKLKIRFGCVQCRKSFHPQCFTAFHFRHALSHSKHLIIDLAIKRVQKVKVNNKQCKHVGNLIDMEYLFERKD